MAKNEAVISASQYNYMKERALKAEVKLTMISLFESATFTFSFLK